MIPSNIQEFVLQSPELTAALVVAIYILLRIQRTLSYREYRFIHLGKTFLFRALDPWATAHGRPLIRPKNQPEESDEFVATVPYPPRTTYQKLRKSGASPHLICTVKSRASESGRQFTHSQLVTMHGDGTQTEWYLFPRGMETDVYGHKETAVTDPTGHTSDAQQSVELPEDF